MNYEHSNRGPRFHIMALLPGWPICWMVRTSLYAYHDNPRDAIDEWIGFAGLTSMTSRHITAVVRGTANPKTGGVPGGIREPALIPQRITALMSKAGSTTKAKYCHLVFPNFNQQPAPHHYLSEDIGLKDEVVEQVNRTFKNDIFVYSTDIDTSIEPLDPDAMPSKLPAGHKDWFAWRLMVSFLNQLPWPLNPAYAIVKDMDIQMRDTAITKNLFEYAADYEDGRAAHLAELS